MVSLDHGDARLKRAEAAEAEVERLRKWCSTAARNYDDMLNAINAVVGGEFETAFHRTAKSLRDASQFMKLAARSEEHTSELQSLMRISYAVFCLKKKKT